MISNFCIAGYFFQNIFKSLRIIVIGNVLFRTIFNELNSIINLLFSDLYFDI